MLNSAFIDFSDKVSSHTLSLFDLNKKCQNHQMISKSRGFTSEMLAVPEQIHSADITYIDTPGEYIGTDGLITDNPEIILIIKVADCVPVYLYEPRSQLIGLVHSGWRGTAGGIVPNAVRKMLKMGADKKEVNVFLGPAIGFCCYEVDGDVADNFNKNTKRKMESGKWKVGLHEHICLQLAEIGIPTSKIMVSDICTFESLDCHSYRRDGEKAGRMFAFMGLK